MGVVQDAQGSVLSCLVKGVHCHGEGWGEGGAGGGRVLSGGGGEGGGGTWVLGSGFQLCVDASRCAYPKGSPAGTRVAGFACIFGTNLGCSGANARGPRCCLHFPVFFSSIPADARPCPSMVTPEVPPWTWH